MNGKELPPGQSALLNATSSEDLMGQLANLGPARLSRDRRVRTNLTTEKWCIRAYFQARIGLGNFSFPVQLFQMDRPDFLLIEAGVEAGIEVTEAIPEKVAKARALAESHGIDFFTLGGLSRSNSEIARDPQAIVDHLKDSKPQVGPFSGDEVKREVSSLLKSAVERKLLKMNGPGYFLYRRNELLIYQNSGLPAIDWDAIDMRGIESANQSGRHRFDAIHILSSGELLSVPLSA